MSRLHSAVAALQGQIARAERQAQIATGAPVEPGRYPLPVDQIAFRNYKDRVAFDTELRNMDDRHSMSFVDDVLVEELRQGIAGALSDEKLETLVGKRIDRHRRLGNMTVTKSSPEWRALARPMCV